MILSFTDQIDLKPKNIYLVAGFFNFNFYKSNHDESYPLNKYNDHHR